MSPTNLCIATKRFSKPIELISIRCCWVYQQHDWLLNKSWRRKSSELQRQKTFDLQSWPYVCQSSKTKEDILFVFFCLHAWLCRVKSNSMWNSFKANDWNSSQLVMVSHKFRMWKWGSGQCKTIFVALSFVFSSLTAEAQLLNQSHISYGFFVPF